MKNKATRRDVLRCAAAAVAAPYVITSTALGADDKPAASERIVMGGIGIGNMGRGDLGAFLGRKDVQYVAVCDVKKGAREGAKKRADDRYKNSDCKAYVDFRELVARDDIDAVHIATPDHWHSTIIIAACRNGKDVFCQKPETLTLADGSTWPAFFQQRNSRPANFISPAQSTTVLGVMAPKSSPACRSCW